MKGREFHRGAWRTLADIEREEKARRRNGASLAVAVVVSLLATGVLAFGAGRAAEASLALDAFGTAEHGRNLLAEYVPVAEGALLECIQADSTFQRLLDAEPVWASRVRAMMVQAGTQ